ncbi:MAG: ABC transporter permease [Lachnospiraceae bacterium]|nr:ABC transporter permease [Lachnospiraceae bacterium]
MIDLYGEDITVSGEDKYDTLSDCRLDISFVKQNNGYDVLLDEKRMPLHLMAGEIGVPMIILDQYDISLGDKIIISADGTRKQFTVAAYVYDGMMNSTTCSSTRFLISDADFDLLLGNIGETEYLIETYFTDSSLASAYQTAYEESDKNLPKNGQAITYTIIFLLSALTDILTAFVFVLTGIMLIIVVIICLRYVILAELEDDVVEIGTMKSIGIPDKGIENLYLAKIRILMSMAGIVGFILALLLLPVFTGHISRFFGEQPLDVRFLLLAAVAVVLIYCIILLFAKKVLKQIKTKTIVDLLVLNDGFSKKVKIKSGLHKSGKLSVNALIGLQEVRRGYGIVFTLMLIITILVMVPIRSLQTMQAQDFVTYMGSPICDLLIEVTQGESLEERNAELSKLLSEEAEMGCIQNIDVLRRVRLQAFGSMGEPVGVHIDTGLSAGKGIVYLSGSKPSDEKHIALSYLLADELGKEIGDMLDITAGNQTYSFEICGIYQDVTSGGRTAKTLYDFPGEASEKYTYQLELSADGTSASDISADEFADNLKSKLGSGYSIKSMDGFLDQTLGGVTAGLGQAVYLVIVISFVITIFIVLLFMELRLARTMRALAEKIAIGIPIKAICIQELYPMLFTGGAGVILGITLTELIGEKLVSALFSLLGLGITSFSFSPMTIGCILVPVSLISILAIINLSVCMKIQKIDISGYVNQ